MGVLALALSGAAVASPAAAEPGAEPVRVAPEMLLAMERDLGLERDGALRRLAKERAAGEVGQRLRGRLGAAWAGAWLAPEDQRLVVAVTDDRGAAAARAEGVEVRRVARSARELDGVVARLDAVGARAGRSIAGWYADVTTNSVVVLVHPAARGEAEALVAASGADPAAIRVVGSAERPVRTFDLRGGDPYHMSNGSRCSIGFPVTDAAGAPGFATAGHCGTVGTATYGFNGVAQGTVRGSVFPGADIGWVGANASWTPRPWVGIGAGNTNVDGVRPAFVGASVCRSGSTSGWRCGVIQAHGVTVRYVDGSTVNRLTRASACTSPGDSGGSWLSGGQAQGVTSGGSVNCAENVAYYQPVIPLLINFRLTLTSTTPIAPVITSLNCFQSSGWFSCTLSEFYSPGSTSIRWDSQYGPLPGYDNSTSMSDSCVPGTESYAGVAVTNPHGTAYASWSSACW